MTRPRIKMMKSALRPAVCPHTTQHVSVVLRLDEDENACDEDNPGSAARKACASPSPFIHRRPHTVAAALARAAVC